jgi:hypothetical protein
MWTCPKCGTKVDPSFDVCWHCGTSPDGLEDPTFVRADDAGPIEQPPVVPELNVAGASGRSLPDELVECYQALTLMEAKFIADQLIENGIPALSDTQDMQDALGTWDGNPRVYCRAEDLRRAREWVQQYEAKRQAGHIKLED